MTKTQFAHITDMHLNRPGHHPRFLKSDQGPKLTRIFEHIRDSGIALDFAIITGDLTNHGNVDDYRYLRRLVERGSLLITAPVYVLLGNNDEREAFREGYLGQEPSNLPYYYTETVKGVHLIVLDSKLEGRSEGQLDATQLAWLEDQLRLPSPAGTIVALHHPLLGMAGMLTNQQEVETLIRNYEVDGVLAGHIHTSMIGRCGNALSIVGAGCSYAHEIFGQEEIVFTDYCSYNVLTMENRNLTVQTMTLPYDREVLFTVNRSAFARL